MKRFFRILIVAMGLGCLPIARAQEERLLRPVDGLDGELLRPRLMGRGGFLTAARRHNFYVETELEYPFVWSNRFYLSLGHRDSTPFLDTGGVLGAEFQVEVLHSTETLRLEYELSRSLALKTVQRFEHTSIADRPGHFEGYELGIGLGSPEHYLDLDRFHWELIAGPFVEVANVDADWFLMGRANWDAWRWKPPEVLRNLAPMGISLEARVESVNRGDEFRPLFEFGPTLRMPTLAGNQFDLFAHWFQSSGNPFDMRRDSGVLVGMQFDSWREPQWGHDLTDFKAGSILPSAWGRYDVGIGGDESVMTFLAQFDVFQFRLVAPFTFGIWYQHRQEFHEGDFDNTSYTVACSFDTPARVPVVSKFLARNEPLALGVDFLHRSDHALDPPVSRFATAPTRTTPVGKFLAHSNVNIYRVHLQTLGWDEPYRYKDIYANQTQWLGLVDWRVTLGYVTKNSSRRGNPTGQPAASIGLQTDIASIHGFVAYAEGEYSLHQETPEATAEFGFKRPNYRVFARWEDFAIIPSVSKGGAFYIGFGINL